MSSSSGKAQSGTGGRPDAILTAQRAAERTSATAAPLAPMTERI
jgi:hypothetical protein